MIVNETDPSRRYLPLVQQKMQTGGIAPSNTSFADTVREFVGEVNNMQIDATEQTEKLIRGEPVDIHDVMITAQKARTSFQLLMELRNKGLDLYREVMRMQV